MRRDIVMEHRRIDRCMLCRRERVNEAGLCDVCYSLLSGADLVIATKWLSGVGP